MVTREHYRGLPEPFCNCMRTAVSQLALGLNSSSKDDVGGYRAKGVGSCLGHGMSFLDGSFI